MILSTLTLYLYIYERKIDIYVGVRCFRSTNEAIPIIFSSPVVHQNVL